MNIKKRLNRLVVVVLLFSLTLFLTSCSSKDNSFSFEDLKNDSIFQYREIEWGSSIDEVIDKLPYQIDYVEIGADPIKLYKSQEQFALGEKNSEATFEFQDGKLTTVQFSFKIEENYDQWFDTQLEAMIKQFGEETKSRENKGDVEEAGGIGGKLENRSYTWEAGDTRLTASLTSFSGRTPAVVIAISPIPVIAGK